VYFALRSKPMTFDEAEIKTEEFDVDLSDESNESAPEWECSEDQLATDGIMSGGHAPGDLCCTNRPKHSACGYVEDLLVRGYCHGCGDEILLKRAARHDGAPYCDGCELAPSED